ncbi:MAG: hypothetical protein IKM43_00460 [Clostridia bacterium]|nr:hypothetical protein [Clostridia bacterium]
MKKKKDLTKPKDEKIRDIEIDKQKHLLELGLLIVLFNLFLIGAVTRLGTYINVWYVWLINGILTIYCIIHSIVTMIRQYKNNKYQLFKDKIVVNSIWYATEVEYKEIVRMESKLTFLDKFATKHTCSLVIIFGQDRHRIVLHRITEDINKLIKEIDKLKKLQEKKQKTEE